MVDPIMTLKGKTNHYNVKFLKGYGLSINVKDSKIVLKNGQNDITGKLEKEEFEDMNKLERINLLMKISGSSHI